MKRLRKHCGKVRFFHCGEYGDQTHRPHYHALLFGYDFHDKVLWKVQRGNRYYISERLNSLWAKGHCIIGDVTFESAAYVARYIMKKVTGDEADNHYQVVDRQTGEVLGTRSPEYVTMSRRPGIGAEWFERFGKELYPDDFVVVRGVRMKVPKFYDQRKEEADPKDFRRVRSTRKVESRARAADQTSRRLRDREKVQTARLKLLPRNLGKDEE